MSLYEERATDGTLASTLTWVLLAQDKDLKLSLFEKLFKIGTLHGWSMVSRETGEEATPESFLKVLDKAELVDVSTIRDISKDETLYLVLDIASCFQAFSETLVGASNLVQDQIFDIMVTLLKNINQHSREITESFEDHMGFDSLPEFPSQLIH